MTGTTEIMTGTTETIETVGNGGHSRHGRDHRGIATGTVATDAGSGAGATANDKSCL